MVLDWRVRSGLLCLLLSVYALVFVGQNQSKDEDWMLSAASTFVRHGELHIESTAANEWGSSVFADEVKRAFGPDDAAYTKKGLLPSVAMMPFVLISDLLPRYWSTEATTMLMNPFVIAFTALLIAEVAAKIGYSRSVVLAAALLFGTGTVMLPYTQSAFGEPLVGLLLMAGLWVGLLYHERPSLLGAVTVGTAVALTIAVNPIYGLFAPVFGLWLLGLDPRRWNWGHGVVFSAPTVMSVVILLAYNVVRFGDVFYSGYNLSTNEGFIHPIWYGVFGLLFSAYRGLLWYAPLTVLSVTGWRGLSRANRGLAITTLALFLVNTLALASWWSWHGGVVWGPRFMVPAVPLLALFWLPALQAATEKRGVRIAVIALTVMSLAVQFLGVLYEYNPWARSLGGRFPGERESIATGLADTVMWSPQASAIWGHLTYLLNGEGALAPAILRASFGVALAHFAIVVLLAVLGVLLLRKQARAVWALPLGVVALLVVPALHPAPMHDRALAVAENAKPGGIVFALTDEKWLERVGTNVMIGAHAPTAPDHPYARTRWDRAIDSNTAKPFWLLTWFPPTSIENWQEQYLWGNFAYVSEGWVDDNRLLRFDRRPIPQTSEDAGQLGDLQLVAYGTASYSDGAAVSLDWQPQDEITTDYAPFVHFLDESGAIVHQVDRSPLGGYRTTSSWAEGETVTMRFFAPVPGVTAVRVGWTNPADGNLLPGGPDTPDDFILLEVRN